MALPSLGFKHLEYKTGALARTKRFSLAFAMILPTTTTVYHAFSGHMRVFSLVPFNTNSVKSQ